jgi:hypothetical protein
MNVRSGQKENSAGSFLAQTDPPQYSHSFQNMLHLLASQPFPVVDPWSFDAPEM